MNNANRPPSARGDLQSGAASGQASRPSTQGYSGNRPTSSNNGGSYQPPSARTETHRLTAINALRTTVALTGSRSGRNVILRPYNGNRGNSQPRSYNPPPARSYSAPQTYSAPSRGYQLRRLLFRTEPQLFGSVRLLLRTEPQLWRGGGGGSRGGGGGGSSHGGGGSASAAALIPFPIQWPVRIFRAGPLFFTINYNRNSPSLHPPSFQFSWHCAFTTLPAGRC